MACINLAAAAAADGPHILSTILTAPMPPRSASTQQQYPGLHGLHKLSTTLTALWPSWPAILSTTLTAPKPERPPFSYLICSLLAPEKGYRLRGHSDEILTVSSPQRPGSHVSLAIPPPPYLSHGRQA
eukprot:1146476-Pelagomonas_calceolata.AAC.2